MFQVKEIVDEAFAIVGTCNDPLLFRWVTDAVDLVANKMESQAWRAYLDICTTNGNCVTLPREVGTVLAVNIGGKPTLGKDALFNFHLNGPGDCCGGCEKSWQDLGSNFSTYRDLSEPAKLVAYLSTPEDDGTELLIHGYADTGAPLLHQVNGENRPGMLVPTIYGVAVPDSNAPKVARITGVEKESSKGVIRLSTIDDSGATGTLLGLYEPDEVLPQYQRIKLSKHCGWVRLAYRKANMKISSRYDRIPLNSRFAFLLALRAVKFYNDVDFASAHSFEADATRIELESVDAHTSPVYMPPQIIDMGNGINDRSDFDIR